MARVCTWRSGVFARAIDKSHRTTTNADARAIASSALDQMLNPDRIEIDFRTRHQGSPIRPLRRMRNNLREYGRNFSPE